MRRVWPHLRHTFKTLEKRRRRFRIGGRQSNKHPLGCIVGMSYIWSADAAVPSGSRAIGKLSVRPSDQYRETLLWSLTVRPRCCWQCGTYLSWLQSRHPSSTLICCQASTGYSTNRAAILYLVGQSSAEWRQRPFRSRRGGSVDRAAGRFERHKGGSQNATCQRILLISWLTDIQSLA